MTPASIASRYSWCSVAESTSWTFGELVGTEKKMMHAHANAVATISSRIARRIAFVDTGDCLTGPVASAAL